MYPVGTRIKWSTDIEATLVRIYNGTGEWHITYFPDTWHGNREKIFYADININYGNTARWINRKGGSLSVHSDLLLDEAPEVKASKPASTGGFYIR